jgi:hypothetical protein
MSSNLLKSCNLDVLGYYFIEDGGDGSACVRFFKRESDAVLAEQRLEEEYGRGSLSEGVHELNFSDFQDEPDNLDIYE